MKSSRGFTSLGLILALVIGLAVLGGVGSWYAIQKSAALQQAGSENATTSQQSASSPYASKFRMAREQGALTLGDISEQPSEPYSLAGWTIRSRSTGFIYTIPATVYTKNSYKGAPTVQASSPVMMYPGSGEFLVIHAGGSVSDNLVHETEIVAYHLYTGVTPAWNEHDTVELFDARGRLVSSLAF